MARHELDRKVVGSFHTDATSEVFFFSYILFACVVCTHLHTLVQEELRIEPWLILLRHYPHPL